MESPGVNVARIPSAPERAALTSGAAGAVSLTLTPLAANQSRKGATRV